MIKEVKSNENMIDDGSLLVLNIITDKDINTSSHIIDEKYKINNEEIKNIIEKTEDIDTLKGIAMVVNDDRRYICNVFIDDQEDFRRAMTRVIAMMSNNNIKEISVIKKDFEKYINIFDEFFGNSFEDGLTVIVYKN